MVGRTERWEVGSEKKREEMRDEEKEGEEKYTTTISARDKYVLGSSGSRNAGNQVPQMGRL